MTAFTVTGADLHQAAAWASRVVPAKPTVPVLSGLLLDADDELVVSGYDFDTRASAVVAVTTTEPGQMLLSARLLTAIAKTVARDVPVTFTDAGGAVEIRSGSAEWTMPALPVADYPRLPEFGAPAGVVNAGELRAALARVLPVISREAAPAFLTGVKLESDGEELTIVGTDRYRLAVATLPWQPADADLRLDDLVPGQLLDTAVRAIGADSEQVSIHTDHHAGFGLATDTHLVVGRQMAEDYVRWRNVMPEPSDHHALVDVDALTAAADQALIGGADDRQVLLAFTADGVQVSAAGDNRRARVDAAADLVGDPITVKVNAGFLRDGLTLHGCDKAAIHFGQNPHRPILVLGDDPSYRHTVVPVRLTEQDRRAA